MGQAPSHVDLETRVEDPWDGKTPRGLALIAHGRLGGTFDQPPVRLLAEYMRDVRQLRVITWNARGIGKSGGPNEWGDFGVWMGDPSVDDYRRILRESMNNFASEFPETKGAELFLCGYSAGAVFAGCTRPPFSFPVFSPAHYILISYPVDLLPLIAFFKTGSYFRSVEALVQGHGWENLPGEFNGREPDVAGVLTVSAQHDTFVGYGAWTWVLGTKNSRNVLSQVVVNEAGHDWNGKAHCIVEEVDKWLSRIKG
ncbi:hypothetical protein AAE478_010359 [Parahypoxylon ruwenzoriense]